jgi:hypothetical protein
MPSAFAVTVGDMGNSGCAFYISNPQGTWIRFGRPLNHASQFAGSDWSPNYTESTSGGFDAAMSALQMDVAQNSPFMLDCFAKYSEYFQFTLGLDDPVATDEKFYIQTAALRSKTLLCFLYWIILENIRRMLPNRSNKDF